jgi:hypothetical protein
LKKQVKVDTIAASLSEAFNYCLADTPAAFAAAAARSFGKRSITLGALVNAKAAPLRDTGGLLGGSNFSLGVFPFYEKRRPGLCRSIASWTRRRLVRMKVVAS